MKSGIQHQEVLKLVGLYTSFDALLSLLIHVKSTNVTMNNPQTKLEVLKCDISAVVFKFFDKPD